MFLKEFLRQSLLMLTCKVKGNTILLCVLSCLGDVQCKTISQITYGGNISALFDFEFGFGGYTREDIKMVIIYLTLTKITGTIKYQAFPIIKRPK